MDNKTTVTTIEANEHDAEDFNTESVHIEHHLAEYGEEINHDGSRVHVDTAWATGFVNREGECMN